MKPIFSTTKTTCSYCGVGCGIKIEKGYNGKIKVLGDEDNPVNKGKLCSKGMNLHYVVENKDNRLLHPQMRYAKNLKRARVSWDEALDRTAAVFRTMINKYGPDSVGFYVSGQCLTEEYYIVNKLSKGFIGTNNIDTNSRLCMSSAVVGYKMALGEDAVPVSYEDIEIADCFFITGANPAWCHPILFRRLEAHKEANPDIKIIVADPRRTQTCEMADLHLQIKPGTDITLNNAIAKLLIEKDFIDLEFIKNHTEGFTDIIKGIEEINLYEAADECGVKLKDIELTAEYIGKSKGFISMWAMGLNQSIEGVNKNLSLLNLSLLTGKIGKPGNGPLSLTGQPNAMGGREVGGMSNLLPAHRDLNNPEHRKEVAAFWGVEKIPEKVGYTATEMFDAILDDKLKAIWIICTNPLVSLPNSKKYEAALKKAKFVVVQDISSDSITTHYADVILPAAGWLEKEGTMTNSDRRVSYLPKLVDAPGEALPDLEILTKFANKMNYKGFNYKNTEEIFIEHAALTNGTNISIDGLDYNYLKKNGSTQWPFDKAKMKGTNRLFTDNLFYTKTKKAKLFFNKSNLINKPNNQYPLILTTGRIRDQWHTMTKTGKVNRLNQHIDNAFLEINPVDAEERNLEDGDMVDIVNNNGSVRVKAKISNDIKQGVVFLPMHWGKILTSDKVRANNLTSGYLDPISKEPDFKYNIVEVSKFKKQKQKIIIIGAGAAAFHFITNYRELNKIDEIVVFSKEETPFYNRVQLPDYVNNHKSWNDLLRANDEELQTYNVKIHTNNKIIRIDRNSKTVTDNNNLKHNYDLLLIATGSSANPPINIPSNKSGLFTIRSREDADRLKKRSKSTDKVLIIGGGVLGLEMASSLYETGAKIEIVHRTRSLMERQLDDISSELLGNLIQSKGIKIHYNDEVDKVLHNELNDEYEIKLRSGVELKANSVIFAIGTRPNIGLANKAELDTRFGVKVNKYLQTSDKSIFAMGEIAEFEGMLYGITSAAEEQAKIVANFISGDITSYYKGSTFVSILKFPEIELCALGTSITPESKDYEEIVFMDKSAHYYKKCVVKNDRLVGAILLGDKAEYNEYKKLIDSGMELSDTRLKLLRSNAEVKPVKGRVVCSCNNVGEGNITDEIENGSTEVSTICQNTGAGTGCGSCRPEITKIIANSLKLVD